MVHTTPVHSSLHRSRIQLTPSVSPAGAWRASSVLTQGAVELQCRGVFRYQVLDVHASAETGVSCNTRGREGTR